MLRPARTSLLSVCEILVETTVWKHAKAEPNGREIFDNESHHNLCSGSGTASGDALMNSSHLVVIMIDQEVEALPTTAAFAVVPYAKT
jgi:hypothetical protein